MPDLGAVVVGAIPEAIGAGVGVFLGIVAEKILQERRRRRRLDRISKVVFEEVVRNRREAEDHIRTFESGGVPEVWALSIDIWNSVAAVFIGALDDRELQGSVARYFGKVETARQLLNRRREIGGQLGREIGGEAYEELEDILSMAERLEQELRELSGPF